MVGLVLQVKSLLPEALKIKVVLISPCPRIPLFPNFLVLEIPGAPLILWSAKSLSYLALNLCLPSAK